MSGEPETTTTEKPTTEEPSTGEPPPAEAEPAGEAEPTGRAEPVQEAEEEDGGRWSAFGPQPAPVPTRKTRIWRRVTGVIGHEWTLAAAGSVALSAIMTWPTLREPTRTIPQDIWDPTLQAWQMAWSGHALTHEPTQLWQSNAFYPERYSFAYSDTLLGYAPAGMIGTGPVAALVRYNIMFVLAIALAFFGAYALVRQLGAGRVGSAVAGAAYAYAPWRLAQGGHLHVVSSFGIGLPFGYILLFIVLVAGVGWLIRRRPRIPARLVAFDAIGGGVLAAAAAVMAYPYLRVLSLYPEARRGPEMVTFFSPPLRGFFTSPAESRIWGSAHAAAR